MNAVEDGKRAGRISLQASYTAENDEKSDDVASNPQKTSKFERSKKTYNVDVGNRRYCVINPFQFLVDIVDKIQTSAQDNGGCRRKNREFPFCSCRHGNLAAAIERIFENN